MLQRFYADAPPVYASIHSLLLRSAACLILAGIEASATHDILPSTTIALQDSCTWQLVAVEEVRQCA